MLRHQFKAIFTLIKRWNNLEFYLSITRKITNHKMSVLKLPKVHQSSEMVIGEQHLHGSYLNAKVSVDIVTPLTSTVTKNRFFIKEENH